LQVYLSLLPSPTCFGHVVLTSSIGVNRMAAKLEANIGKCAGYECMSSLRDIGTCLTNGTFLYGFRIVNKMKQIS
jgi:hypothetical protein